MKAEYYYVESTIKPEAVESVGGIVYFRKNIAKVEQSDGGYYWTYYEAKMPYGDFQKYSELLAAENSGEIEQLKQAQSESDDNQLAIMDAIACLYEAFTGYSSES